MSSEACEGWAAGRILASKRATANLMVQEASGWTSGYAVVVASINITRALATTRWAAAPKDLGLSSRSMAERFS